LITAIVICLFIVRWCQFHRWAPFFNGDGQDA